MLQVRRQSVLDFYLIRTCSRSTMKAIARTNTPTPDQCALFALRTRGLAFNYSPLGLNHSRHNCVVCDCPEFETLSSLKKDLRYDYYSLYGNPLRKYRAFIVWHLVTAELDLGLFAFTSMFAASQFENPLLVIIAHKRYIVDIYI